MRLTHYSDGHIAIDGLITSLVDSLVGHVRELWLNGVALDLQLLLNTNGKPTPGIQWYHFQPPSMTHNLRSWSHFWNYGAFPCIITTFTCC